MGRGGVFVWGGVCCGSVWTSWTTDEKQKGRRREGERVGGRPSCIKKVFTPKNPLAQCVSARLLSFSLSLLSSSFIIIAKKPQYQTRFSLNFFFFSTQQQRRRDEDEQTRAFRCIRGRATRWKGEIRDSTKAHRYGTRRWGRAVGVGRVKWIQCTANIPCFLFRGVQFLRPRLDSLQDERWERSGLVIVF